MSLVLVSVICRWTEHSFCYMQMDRARCEWHCGMLSPQAVVSTYSEARNMLYWWHLFSHDQSLFPWHKYVHEQNAGI